MAWNADDDKKQLVYDLRQGLAEILINILKDIEYSFQERNYRAVFEAEDRLFIFVSMKLKETEKNEYNNSVKSLNDLIEKNPEFYLNAEMEGREVYIKLKEIMLWLVGKMERYKMFGGKEDRENL